MSLFFQLTTDRVERPIDFQGRFSGGFASSCWLIGGGPSLLKVPRDVFESSPIPRMGINLSGSRLFRPTFWTSYDPTARFHQSVYLDAGIMKFVHRRRAMDLVSGTTYKVCDCPNLYFFDRESGRGFGDFVSSRHEKIVDWADSMVQAIDILFQLGFRRIYLAGCEMRIEPSAAQIEAAKRKSVVWNSCDRLKSFLQKAEEAGLSADELDRLPAAVQYHFGESKPIRAAANTDEHYFRIAQCLRLSRRAMTDAGLELISVTEGSRLNDYFESMTVEEAVAFETKRIGDPAMEQTIGRYRSDELRPPEFSDPMFDFFPPNWSNKPNPKKKNVAEEPVRVEKYDDEREILFENENRKEKIQKACVKMLADDVICEEG